MVSQDWRNQTPEQRAEWDKKAEADKERYEREMAKYMNREYVAPNSRASELPKRPMR